MGCGGSKGVTENKKKTSKKDGEEGEAPETENQAAQEKVSKLNLFDR